MQTARFSDRDREIEVQGRRIQGKVRVFIHGVGFRMVPVSKIYRISDGKAKEKEIENQRIDT